jgi:RHS repeat-associated protein
MYDYSLAVTLTTSGVNHTQTFTGKQAIVNRNSSEFGAGWWLDGLDRVVDSSSGAVLVKGNGDTLWFPKSGSNYLHAAGDVEYHTFVKNGGGTFTVTSKTGIVSNFSTLGLLTIAYSASGLPTSITPPDPDSAGPLSSPVTGLAYDAYGRLVTITNPDSSTQTFTFNASNGTTVRTITTEYDAASQITSLSDPSSTIDFTLDNLGRATAVAQSVNGLTPTVTLNQSFDVMSNRTELKATIGSTLDFKNTYQYDTLQRLTDIVQQGQSGGNAVTAKHLTFAYNALSQRTEIARYQSTGTSNAVATTDYTFDSANRLSGIAHEQGATDLNTYAYTYDPLSRISTIVSTAEGTDTYSYDQTSQLVGATHTSHSNETNGFDANGNRNTSGFTTGANNQTTAGLGFTYVYDDEGNRITKTETSTGKIEEYTWDHRNRLTKVVFRNTSGGSIVKQVEYEYDPYHRMVRRVYDADGAGGGAATNQYWVYDQGINAVLEFDGASGSDLAHRYLWSNSVDELLADEIVTSLGSGGNVLWALSDHLGSIRDIADYNEGSGVTSVANHRTWNSFGELIAETNAAVDLFFGFTGKQFDEATGLQHNLFRWLDPELGQWLNEDPIGFHAGDANIRRYVSNVTTKHTDPSGLDYNYGWWTHFADAYADYFNPWNGTPGGDRETEFAQYGQITAGTLIIVGASGAVITYATGTAGIVVYEGFSIIPSAAARAHLVEMEAARQAAREATRRAAAEAVRQEAAIKEYMEYVRQQAANKSIRPRIRPPGDPWGL